LTTQPAQRSDKTAPLHQRIRSDIEAQILSGELAPGERIPFEYELMARYDCARATVNKAISALADSALVVRRKKAGTFVALPRVQSVVLDIPDIQNDIVRRGGVYGLRLLARSRRPARQREPHEAALSGEGGLLELTCLHLADGRPFALEERLINLTVVPEAADVDFAAVAPGAWLLGHVPWTEAEHRITAVNVRGQAAERLALPVEAACLMLERRTWRGEDHITYVRQTFPGEVYDLIARFEPRRG
jgi:GntR family histidine utilization transcriptional repressor